MSAPIILLGILAVACMAIAIFSLLRGGDSIAAIREIGTANLLFGFIVYVRRTEDQLVNVDTPGLMTWGSIPPVVWATPLIIGLTLILIVIIKKRGRLYYSDNE